MSTAEPEPKSSFHEESTLPSNKSVSCGQSKSRFNEFNRHKLLAYSISKNYASKFSWLRQDIEQEALLALWEATQKFDATQGAKFSTFAYRTIHGRILDFIKSEMRHVKAKKPKDTGSKLTAAFQEEPIPAPDLLSSDFDLAKEYEREAINELIGSTLACLTEKELDVVRLLFWRDLAATDVARTISISNARVSMLAANARKRLRPIFRTLL